MRVRIALLPAMRRDGFVHSRVRTEESFDDVQKDVYRGDCHRNRNIPGLNAARVRRGQDNHECASSSISAALPWILPVHTGGTGAPQQWNDRNYERCSRTSGMLFLPKSSTVELFCKRQCRWTVVRSHWVSMVWNYTENQYPDSLTPTHSRLSRRAVTQGDHAVLHAVGIATLLETSGISKALRRNRTNHSFC